jgi:hypothetical protein
MSISACIAIAVPPARGELIITVGDGLIDPGGTLRLDVGIESLSGTENLADFTLILEISPINGTGSSSLRFVDPQSEAVLKDADYVFAMTSEAIAENDSTIVAGDPPTPTVVTIEDFSVDQDGDSIDVPVTGRKLLAKIDLIHLLAGETAGAIQNDEYTISVSDDSEFWPEFGDELSFIGSSGTVTFAAVAIPEPGFALLLTLATGGLAVRRRRA